MGHSDAYGVQPTWNALTPEVLRVLRGFAAAIGHHTMYADGHPMLAVVAKRLRSALGIPLNLTESLTITVHRDCVDVGGVDTDPSDLLVSGLANRLHLHQLHSLTFRRGVRTEELTELLQALSQKVGHGSDPLGLAPEEELNRWRHIGVLRQDRERHGADDQRARPPFFTTLAGRHLAETELRRVASSIEARLHDDHVGGSVAVEVFMLAEDLRDASGEEAEILCKRMSDMIFLLGPDTLTRLLALGEKGHRDTRYLRDCSEWMEPEALIELVRVAGESRSDGVVPWVLRLSSKLAGQRSPADGRHGSEADSAIRTTVRRLIEEWELEDQRLADREDEFEPYLMGPSTPRDVGESGVRVVPPARTVEISIELDAPNEQARRASARLLSGGEAASLLDILETAPDQSNVASQLWRGVSAPQVLRYLLEAEDPDLDTVHRITEHVGLEGVESMLDVLARSKRRSAREYLLGQISGMGPAVGPHVAGLLGDRRWYVVRNMLHLLNSLSVWPEGFDVAPYLAHEHPRVRIEALRLAGRWPAERERAVCLALQDEDQEVVSAGLAEASASCPPAAERILVRHLHQGTLPVELRIQAIRALGALGSNGALKAISGACVRHRWLFGKQLSSETAVVQAGVVELASRWPKAKATKRVLRLAERSGDPDLSAAAAGDLPEDVA